MSKKFEIMSERSESFESWNIDDDSNSPTKINIPHETKGFTNILQINKGYAYHSNFTLRDFQEPLRELNPNELGYVAILEISDEENSNSCNSSESNEFNEVMFIPNFLPHKIREKRSRAYSDLFRSNIWDKHRKETPSVEILSKIMPS